mgnify:CR=1 FL=1
MSNYFSIIVPSLNQGKFLNDCLKSIVNQKYKKFEVIILDGGSNDQSIKIIKKFAKKYSSITYWHTKKDKGQFDAINFGIRKAKGNWITWQNADDFFNSNNVLNIFNKNINLNPRKKLFVGNMNLVSRNKKIIKKLNYIKPNFYSLLYEGMTLSNQCSFWHSSINKKIGFLKNYKVDFDYEWYLRILSKFPNTGYHLNFPAGSYRLHDEQKTFKKKKNDLKRIEKIKIKYGISNSTILRSFMKHLFIVKRGFYYLSKGEFYYVLRGIFNKFFSFYK